jgi:hypothetical protein
LDDANVGPALQKVGGKAVPQRVGGHTLADPRLLARGAAGRLESYGADMNARPLTGGVHLRSKLRSDTADEGGTENCTPNTATNSMPIRITAAKEAR